MYIPTNVAKPSGVSPGAASAKDPNITIYRIEDLAVIPPRDSKGIVMQGNFVNKPGTYPITIYCTPSKFKASAEPEGEEDAQTAKHKVEMSHPGNKKEIREFIQNYTDVPVLIVFGTCTTTDKDVYGTKCAPMKLKGSSEDDNNGIHQKLMFEQHAKSPYYPAIYQGAIQTQVPTLIADPSAVDINPTDGNFYEVPSTTTGDALTFIAPTIENGQVVTLIGGGGSNPHRLVSGNVGGVSIILTSGSEWSAVAGSTISLRFRDAGAVKYFDEVNRT